MYNQIFFTNILRILDEHGMKKTEFAKRAGISDSFLSDLTNGKGNPTLTTMETISNALGVPLSLLLEHTDLNAEALAQLGGNTPVSSLPEGFKRVSAVLTTFQAFKVENWHQENCAQLKAKKT